MSWAPVYLILGFAGFYKNEIIAAAPSKNLLLSLEVKGALNQYLEALPIKKSIISNTLAHLIFTVTLEGRQDWWHHT